MAIEKFEAGRGTSQHVAGTRGMPSAARRYVRPRQNANKPESSPSPSPSPRPRADHPARPCPPGEPAGVLEEGRLRVALDAILSQSVRSDRPRRVASHTLKLPKIVQYSEQSNAYDDLLPRCQPREIPKERTTSKQRASRGCILSVPLRWGEERALPPRIAFPYLFLWTSWKIGRGGG